jgi:phosphate transport system substrate-binding protein
LYLLLTVAFLLGGIIIVFPIVGSFLKSKNLRRICRTIVLTEIILIEVLLLSFNSYAEGVLFVIQFVIIVLVVWNPLDVSKLRRIVYLVILLLMIVLVSGADIYIKTNTVYESPMPLKEKNYEPFTAGNVLATLDTPPDIDFDEKYPLPKLDGATAMYPYYAAVYQELYDSSLDKDTYLNCSSSQNAFEKMNEGDADILFLAGISQFQIQNYSFPYTETPLCKDAFVFIVPFDNPVRSVTIKDLKEIYNGSIENWNVFAKYDYTIELYKLMGRNMGSNIALTEFLGINENIINYRYEVSGMGPMIIDVYHNGGGALGYTYRFFVTDMMSNYEVKLLKINDIAPTSENIENGSYPFVKEFIAVSRDDTENPNVQILIDWLQSPQGQELAEKTGYVPIN